jgi:hypothetical protein
VLELHWESTDGKTRTAQIVLPRSKVREVLVEIHEGTSEGHLGVKKILEKARRRYYWLYLSSDFEKWCRQCDICTARRGARSKMPGPVPQANVGAALNEEQSAIEYAAERQHYARQSRKGASDRMKARYDRLANSAGFQEGERVWLYRPTRKRGKSPKLQSCWEDPYNVITRINDVVYRIQRHLRSKMMVIHLGRLAPYLGAIRNE